MNNKASTNPFLLREQRSKLGLCSVENCFKPSFFFFKDNVLSLLYVVNTVKYCINYSKPTDWRHNLKTSSRKYLKTL